MAPLPVTFVSHTAQLYGAPESLLLLLARLDRDRLAPTLFCPYDGPLPARAEALGVPVVRAVGDRERRRLASTPRALRGLRFGPSYVRALRATLRRTRPAAVHLNSIGLATPALLARAAGVPVVVHVREAGSYLRGWKNRLRRLPLLHGPKRWIAVSSAVAGLLVEHGAPADRVDVVHNGVDVHRFGFDADARTRLRAELGLGEDQDSATLIGCVAAIEPRKGVDLLLDAAHRLGDPNVHVCVVGGVKDPAYDRALRQRLDEIPALRERVHLLGYRDDARDWYSAFDVVANPTREEPFARVNLEAMACGRPIVATAVDGNPEAVVDGTTGRLVPVDDVDAFRDALRELALDPARRARFGRAARDRAVETFGADRYAASVERILHEVATRIGDRAPGDEALVG